MKQTQTKHAAEAVLRELPSVIGACVHEDITGRPREVHLLVRPVPSVRDLAQDVRELLEERLEMPIDQRIISIAQIAAQTDENEERASAFEEDGGTADRIGTSFGPPSSTPPVSQRPQEGAARRADPRAEPSPAEPVHESAPAHPSTERERPAPPGTEAHTRSAAADLASVGPSRLVYEGLETHARATRVSVRVRLSWRGAEFVGESNEVDAGQGRARAAAGAVVRAAAAACRNSVRLELEAASVSRALERDYALVSVLAMAPWLGRQPVALVGAHPVEGDVLTAAALAVLKATNRVVERSLEIQEQEHSAD